MSLGAPRKHGATCMWQGQIHDFHWRRPGTQRDPESGDFKEVTMVAVVYRPSAGYPA